jgi:hypothetical protein
LAACGPRRRRSWPSRQLGPVDEVIVGAAGALAPAEAARALGDGLLAATT